MKPDQSGSAQVVRRSDPMPEQGGSLLGTPNRIRIVQLRRRGNAALGFSIRGGREHGTGVFVSHVTPGSESHHRGLRVGDQIIRINGYPIDHFVHEEVLAVLKARPSIVLKVKSVGMIPVKDNKRDPITWKLVEPEQCSSGSDGTHSVSSGSSLDEPVETKVFISGIGSSSLGCSVVKGPPEIPGIFVQTVKPNGLAEMAGLEIGDQITEVNGRTFDNLEFAEAIAMLKSFKEMALTVKKGAGMELFLEERLHRCTLGNNGHNRVSNGTDHRCHIHHSHHFNGNHHNSHENGLQESEEGSPGSWTSAHGTVTNGSVMSGMSTRSIGGSLSSSQSISPVANGHGSRNSSNPSHRLELCHEHRAAENGVSQHLSAEAEERQRLEEEKRRLQEKEEQLKLEAEKLAEERRRLEAQKSVQQTSNGTAVVPPPCNLPPPPQRHVFAELHSVAEKKRLSRENSAQPNGDCSRKNNRNGLRPDSAPSQDVLIKQKQHEQLMVEFREVHQKMFGGNVTSAVEIAAPVDRKVSAVQAASKKASSASQNSQGSHYQRRQMRPSVDQLPAPPSAVHFEQTISREAVPRGEAKESLLPQPTATPNASESLMESGGGGWAKKQWPAYVPPAHPNPHMFIQPASPQKGTTITRQSLVAEKRKPEQLPNSPGKAKAKGPAPAPPVSKDVPITDSRGPESKPPRTFFNEKPLVTIGTYPDPNNNPRPNRFVGRTQKVEIVDTDNKSVASEKAAKTPDISSTSLKSSIPIEKVLPGSSPKMTVSINTKPPNHPTLSTRFSSALGTVQVPVNNINGAVSNISNNIDVAEGAVVKTLTFRKDGVLNLNIEGGLNSAHEGRIIVSEIREGGPVPLDGEIQKGDQLLMVENTRLVNVSLTAARVALQNAMGTDGKDLRLTIAKLPR